MCKFFVFPFTLWNIYFLLLVHQYSGHAVTLPVPQEVPWAFCLGFLESSYSSSIAALVAICVNQFLPKRILGTPPPLATLPFPKITFLFAIQKYCVQEIGKCNTMKKWERKKIQLGHSVVIHTLRNPQSCHRRLLTYTRDSVWQALLEGMLLNNKSVLCLDWYAGYRSRFVWWNSHSCMLKVCVSHCVWNISP